MAFISDHNRKLADYIYDDLSPEEIVNMEMEIAEDPALSDSYRRNMEVKKYLQAKRQLEEMRSDPLLMEAESLADQVFRSSSSRKPSPPARQRSMRSKKGRKLVMSAGIAATVAVLLAVGLISAKPDPSQLYQHYYGTFQASDYTQRGDRIDNYQVLSQGIDDYMEGRYQESILQFQQLNGSSPTQREEMLFYTGLSYMGMEQFEDAVSALEELVGFSSRYLPETLWYLGLCKLQLGEVEDALSLFSRLEIYEGYFKNDAQALLKKLRRIKTAKANKSTGKSAPSTL